jgi:hypothetical protein
MPRSLHNSGVRSASTTLTGHSDIARNVLLCRLTLRLLVGLAIAAVIVIGLTRPSGAQTTSRIRTETTAAWHQQRDDHATPFARCLQDWDAGTHMTKQEWSEACQRLLLQRGDYLRKQPQ